MLFTKDTEKDHGTLIRPVEDPRVVELRGKRITLEGRLKILDREYQAAQLAKNQYRQHLAWDESLTLTQELKVITEAAEIAREQANVRYATARRPEMIALVARLQEALEMAAAVNAEVTTLSVEVGRESSVSDAGPFRACVFSPLRAEQHNADSPIAAWLRAMRSEGWLSRDA